MMKKGYTYIIVSKNNGRIFIGICSDLKKRMFEHKNGLVDGFTKKYKVDTLVYYNEYIYIQDAIFREKYLRHKKRNYINKLVEKENPDWNDLSEGWFE
jgi:putative endonuclease